MSSITGGTYVTCFAAALFALYALIHIYVSHKQKAHFFYLMSLGAVIQTIGLIVSAVCVTDATTSSGYMTVSPATYFVPMFMFIFAQSLIIVSCYMVLSRFLWFAAPSHQRTSDNFLISPNHITTMVSIYEIITLIVTITGSALMIDGATDYSLYGNNDENVEDVISGFRVVLAGLVFQLCSRVYLMIVGWRVSFVSKNWTVKPTGLKYDTRTQLNVVNLSSILLTMRALFQVIVLGARIKVAPWMYYAFDAAPLLFVLVNFGGIHPGHVFPSRFLRWRLDTKSLTAEEWEPSATPGDSNSTEMSNQ